MTAGLLKRLAVATLLAGAACARAGDGDLRVLSDEITERGDFGLDLQTGVSRKARDAALEGRGRIDGLVEFSYGLADNWETSLQLPVARQGGRSYAEGTNLEFQFVARTTSNKARTSASASSSATPARRARNAAGRPNGSRSWATAAGPGTACSTSGCRRR